jgi:hypothetical protein
MNQPACQVYFEKGNIATVAGTPAEVREALKSGGLVELDDPWGRKVTINAANVTQIQEMPGGIGEPGAE